MRTRAVLRPIEPANGGTESYCASCDERIAFRARQRRFKVICNVYAAGRWDRCLHFHEECYRGEYGDLSQAPRKVYAR